MDLNDKFRMVEAEHIDGDVCVTFGDGKTYLFSVHVLRAHIDEAERSALSCEPRSYLASLLPMN